MKTLGRLKPYTAIGILRVPCARCGKPSRFQWQTCALRNRYLGICTDCDIALNAVVLAFFGVPNAARLMKAYIKRVR